jgi:hypothetical protein
MKKPCNEFRIIGVPEGVSADAALHEDMLGNEKANMMSDLAAIRLALEDGMAVEDAARLLAGPMARARLIEIGLLKE